MVSCLFLHFFQKHRTVLRSIRHTRPPPVWVDAPPDAARPHAGIPSSPEEELGCSVPAGPRRSQKREGVVQNVNTSKPTHPNQQKQRKQSNDTKQKQQKQPPAKPTHNRTQNTHKHKQTTQPNSVVPQVVDKKTHPGHHSATQNRTHWHSADRAVTRAGPDVAGNLLSEARNRGDPWKRTDGWTMLDPHAQKQTTSMSQRSLIVYHL